MTQRGPAMCSMLLMSVSRPSSNSCCWEVQAAFPLRCTCLKFRLWRQNVAKTAFMLRKLWHLHARFPLHAMQMLWSHCCINCNCFTDSHRWYTPKTSGTVPGARDGHSACVLGKAMYIFGGYEQLVRVLFCSHENSLWMLKLDLINLLCSFYFLFRLTASRMTSTDWIPPTWFGH